MAKNIQKSTKYSGGGSFELDPSTRFCLVQDRVLSFELGGRFEL